MNETPVDQNLLRQMGIGQAEVRSSDSVGLGSFFKRLAGDQAYGKAIKFVNFEETVFFQAEDWAASMGE